MNMKTRFKLLFMANAKKVQRLFPRETNYIYSIFLNVLSVFLLILDLKEIPLLTQLMIKLGSLGIIMFTFVTTTSYLAYCKNLQKPLNLENTLFLTFICLLPHAIFWLSFSFKPRLLDFFLISTIIQWFIVFPCMYNSAKLCHWHLLLKESSWGSPIFFLKNSLGVTYFLIFICYLFLIRYLIIGNVINYSFLINKNIIVIIFLLILLIMLYKLILHPLKRLLYTNWIDTIYVCNLICLQNKVYFHVMHTLFKISFIIVSLVLAQKDYKDKKFISAFIFYLYMNPWICPMFLILYSINEFFLTKQLYYSLYLIYLFALYYPIWYCLFNFSGILWNFDKSLSDYLAKNFENITYPKTYSEYFLKTCNEIKNVIGFSWPLSDSEKNVLDQYKKQKYYFSQPSYRFFKYRETHSNIPIVRNFAIDYRIFNGHRLIHKRFTHTTAISTTLHPSIGFFLKNPFLKGTLLNYKWMPHYDLLCQRQGGNDSYNMSKHFKTELIPNFKPPHSFPSYVETNTLLHFQKMIKNGIIAKTQIDTDHPLLFLRQSNPDVKFLITKQPLQYYIAYDLKNQTHYGLTSNTLLSRVSHEEYVKMLDTFVRFYRTNHGENAPKCRMLCDQLKKFDNIQNEQDFWEQHIYDFHPFHPPLRIPMNFNVESDYLTEEGVKISNEASEILDTINNYLIANNAPITNRSGLNPQLVDFAKNTSTLDFFKQLPYDF